MTKLSNTSFNLASNPALEKVGEITGMALGKMVRGNEAVLLQGLDALAKGSEAMGMSWLAKAGKVMTQVIQSTGKMPFAGPELEADENGKPKSRSALAKGFNQGFSKAMSTPTPKPKGRSPGLAPT